MQKVINLPFRPTGVTKRVTPSTVTQTFDMGRRKPLQTMSVRLVNKGPDYCAIEFGGPSCAATFTGSMCLLPDSIETFTVLPNETHIAIISEGSTNEVQITEGISS